MRVPGRGEQVETRRILAGKTLVLIRLVFNAFLLMLFERLLARAYCVAVSALKPTSLHVGIQDFNLGMHSRSVLSQPRLGLESLLAHLALVWIGRLLFLFLLDLLAIFLLVKLSNVPNSIS